MLNTDILKINKVSAIAGASKTTRAIELSIKLAEAGELVIFSVPSIKKVGEVYRAIRDKINHYDECSFNVRKVSSESRSEKTVSEMISEETDRLFFEKTEFSRGGILVCTHEGFLLTQTIKRKDQFHLFWDEAHTILRHISGPMQSKFKDFYLNEFLEVEDVFDENGNHLYCTADVKPGKIDAIKDRLSSKSIGIRDSQDIRTLTGHLLSAAQGHCGIQLNRGYKESDKLDVVFFYNQMPFSGLKSVTFLGALLERTNLFKWFNLLGVKFVDHPEFDDILAKKKHSIRLKVYYANKSHRHSKYFLNMKIDEKPVRDIFREKAFDVFNALPIDEKVLVMCNEDNIKSLEPLESEHYNFKNPNGRFIKCPWNCEGMNEFRDIKNGMYIGSFNQESQYHHLISHFGIEDFGSHYHLYQYIMRMSCRNEDNSDPVTITLPCLKLFEPLLEYFDEDLIELIPLNVPEEMMYFVDKRGVVMDDDKRRKEVALNEEWYLVNQDNMKRFGIPWKNTINDYCKWFEKRGWRRHVLEIEIKYNSKNKRKKKFTIVHQWPDGIEKAESFLVKNHQA